MAGKGRLGGKRGGEEVSFLCFRNSPFFLRYSLSLHLLRVGYTPRLPRSFFSGFLWTFSLGKLFLISFSSLMSLIFFFFECFFLQPNTFCPKCLPHDLTVPNATALRSFSPPLLVVASRFRLCSVCVRWPMHVVCETCMFCDLGFSWCSSFIWPIVLFQYTIFRLSLRDDGHFLDCTVICFFTLHT